MTSTATKHLTPVRADGPSYENVSGLHVLRVKGSFYEMGKQHGEMLREHIPDGPLPYYKTYIERIMGPSLVGKLLWPVLNRTIGARVAKAIPDFVEETLKGLAAGSGLSERAILAGATMPDSLMWLAARVLGWQSSGPALHHRLALGLGCTSAVAWGDATEDGRLLHARNLDYHGVSCWPKTAAVIFHTPDEGQRYVSVAAAGVPMGGITSMNEAGITMTVHQHMFTDKTRLGGTPIGFVGDLVMRYADSIEAAQEIFSNHTPIGCWTYLVTDGKRKEVLCWEENPDRNVAHRAPEGEDTFSYTNVYIDEALGETELDVYGSYWRHNQGRWSRARTRLAEGHGDHSPTSMAGILADLGSGECRFRDAARMLLTVGAVVFRPEDGVLWVSTGEAPVSQNTFVPFSLATEAHAPEYGDLTDHAVRDSESEAAFTAYRDAYTAYLDQGDIPMARRHMATALHHQPRQALYHSVAGLLAMKDGQIAEAFEAFDRAVQLGHVDPERVAAFHVWRGRAADLAGRREDALKDYREALTHRADPPMKRAAEKGLKRSYSRGKSRRVNIDFTFADVMAP